MKKTINRSKTKKEDKKQVKNEEEKKLHKINTFFLNNEGTYKEIVKDNQNLVFGKFIDRPSATDPEDEEEEEEDEDEESKSTFSRGDNSLDHINPVKPKPKPKPKAPYHDWYTKEIKNLPDGRKRNEKAKNAVESFAKVMDEYKVSSGDKIFGEVPKGEFEAEYKNTSYFKHFREIPRYPDLEKAIDDMCHLFPYEECKIKDTYDKYKDDPAKVVTKIWTGQQKITKLINFALIVDAGKYFNFNKDDMKYFEDRIIKKNKHENEIIKFSIKFMRLLSSYIVDQGWEHNTEDRFTYRGVNVPVMKMAGEGKTYRLITWNATSESKDVMNIYGNDGKGSTITFIIRKNCLNAGRVNKFGETFFKDEEETIIPPYSVCQIRKKINNDFVVDLAFDNQNVDFSDLPIY